MRKLFERRKVPRADTGRTRNPYQYGSSNVQVVPYDDEVIRDPARGPIEAGEIPVPSNLIGGNKVLRPIDLSALNNEVEQTLVDISDDAPEHGAGEIIMHEKELAQSRDNCTVQPSEGEQREESDITRTTNGLLVVEGQLEGTMEGHQDRTLDNDEMALNMDQSGLHQGQECTAERAESDEKSPASLGARVSDGDSSIETVEPEVPHLNGTNPAFGMLKSSADTLSEFGDIFYMEGSMSRTSIEDVTVAIFDATSGLGSQLLHLCLQDERVKLVVAITKEEIVHVKSSKLRQVISLNLKSMKSLEKDLEECDFCFMCSPLKTVNSNLIAVDLPIKLAASLHAMSPEASFHIACPGLRRQEQDELDHAVRQIHTKSVFWQGSRIAPTQGAKEFSLAMEMMEFALHNPAYTGQESDVKSTARRSRLSASFAGGFSKRHNEYTSKTAGKGRLSGGWGRSSNMHSSRLSRGKATHVKSTNEGAPEYIVQLNDKEVTGRRSIDFSSLRKSMDQKRVEPRTSVDSRMGASNIRRRSMNFASADRRSMNFTTAERRSMNFATADLGNSHRAKSAPILGRNSRRRSSRSDPLTDARTCKSYADKLERGSLFSRFRRKPTF